jgi:drug/metabolite transporter (DMT)-like permease
MKRADWLLLLLLSGLWGGSFLFYRILATELPPLTTVFSRVSIGAASILVVLAAQGQHFVVPRPQWRRVAVLATLNNVLPFSLFAWAETRISGGSASILNALTPIFVVLVTGLILRTEKLTAARLAGIGCGLAGVVVLVGPEALLGADLAGQGACLLAALSYGFALPYGRHITGLAPPVLAAAQLSASTLILLPLMLAIDQPWALASPSLAGWGAVLGLGLLSTGLAYMIFFRLLASAGPTNLSLVTLLVPVSAMLLGRLVLDEPITLRALAGMALIGTGLAAIDGRIIPVVFRRDR